MLKTLSFERGGKTFQTVASYDIQGMLIVKTLLNVGNGRTQKVAEHRYNLNEEVVEMMLSCGIDAVEKIVASSSSDIIFTLWSDYTDEKNKELAVCQ